MRKFVIEGQAWKALSMAMESQLEQAWDQYIWRQREALAKRKKSKVVLRGEPDSLLRLPIDQGLNPGVLVLAQVLLYQPPKHTSMLPGGQTAPLQSSECCCGLSYLHCHRKQHARGLQWCTVKWDSISYITCACIKICLYHHFTLCFRLTRSLGSFHGLQRTFRS